MHGKGKAMGQQQVCLEHSWKTCTPKQPDLLVGNWAIFEKRAGTPSWSDSVSHDRGSFVECGPTIMPHSPALLFGTERDTHTHTHTCRVTELLRCLDSGAKKLFLLIGAWVDHVILQPHWRQIACTRAVEELQVSAPANGLERVGDLAFKIWSFVVVFMMFRTRVGTGVYTYQWSLRSLDWVCNELQNMTGTQALLALLHKLESWKRKGGQGGIS